MWGGVSGCFHSAIDEVLSPSLSYYYGVELRTTSIPDELKDVLVSTTDTFGGSVRFQGTRVPLRALVDTVHCGRIVEYFLEGYPGVTREQAGSVLGWAPTSFWNH